MTTTPQLFHTLTVADAPRARAFLTALGFTETLVVENEHDPSILEHAEFRWRDSGGVMLGSAREDNSCAVTPGRASCYLVVETDTEVDATYARALAAGGTRIQEPADRDYGGRGATVADTEGNLWSIGSYAGA